MTTSAQPQLTGLRRRTITRADWVPCKAAFIDCRTPGSDLKDNYSFIGVGVSQSSEQFINLSEPHGFQTGAAGMPHGTTNSLHMHFTAEVFINFGGTYRVRWGADGTDGEYLSTDGDIISVPPWIFRGFTNEGSDQGVLLTVLGHDDTGGIIWGPTVLEQAADHGLYLTLDNMLVDTVAGQPAPPIEGRITPMDQREIDTLTPYSVADMRARVSQVGDRTFDPDALLCSRVDGGRVGLNLVIGYGISENRRLVPRLTEPHSFNLAVVRAEDGQGLLRHRHDQPSVLMVRTGVWEVTVLDGDGEETVRVEPADQVSVPAGAWRSGRLVEGGADGAGELIVVCASDGRVEIVWAPEVIEAASDNGWVLDPNGYLAPSAVLPRTALATARARQERLAAR
ncbi:hypothetical protein HJ590_08645 [Naumannella sp. ID2617S]|nr:hypothetical protein [Naumannella sp. ID2617S]